MIEPAPAGSDTTSADAERTLRVAIAGIGRSGLGHAAALAMMPGVELVAATDPGAPARRRLGAFGFRARIHPSHGHLLANDRPDALFVCAPQHRRAAIARAAIEAGVPVYVDRPIAHTLADAEAVVALAAARGVPLAVGHTLGLQPVFAAARTALAAGALGRVQRARASIYVSRVFNSHQSRRHAPGRVAGGVLAHVAGDLLFVLGRMFGPVAEARATWSRLYGELEDELHGMMRLADGAEVGLDTSWSVPGHPRAAAVIEVEGGNGRLLVSDDALELELQAAAGGYPAGVSVRRDADLPQSARFDVEGEALYLGAAGFLAWVAGGPPPSHTGEAALATHRVMEALYASARAGGVPRSVPA